MVQVPTEAEFAALEARVAVLEEYHAISPPDPPPPDPPPPEPDPTPVGDLSFAYLGAMRVPFEVDSWSDGAMTMRRVNGQLRFLMAGHRTEGAPIIEFADTGSYHPNPGQAPRGQFVKNWGSPLSIAVRYDGQGNPYPLGRELVTDLHWQNDRLYMQWINWYNVTQEHDYSLGMANLSGSTMQLIGPWRWAVKTHNSAGWIIALPDGSVGVGSGLQAGNAGSSWGPQLRSGGTLPTDSTPSGLASVDIQTPNALLHYPFGDVNKSLPRDGNYVSHGSLNYKDPAVTGGVGSWTEMDNIGTAVSIGDHLVFIGGATVGHVWYGDQTCSHGVGDPCGANRGPHSSETEPRWWIYDLNEIGQVGQTWEERPIQEVNPNSFAPSMKMNCYKQINDAHYDVQTGRLFLSAVNAESGTGLPLIHVFTVS
jgi:hypothetical protein